MHHRAQCLNMLRQLGVTPLPPSSVAEWTWLYIPRAFRNDDLETLHAFMRRHSFATLITGGCEPFATHLPLLLDASRGTDGTLIGHFARPNPHWQCDHQRNGSLATFTGRMRMCRLPGIPAPRWPCPIGTMRPSMPPGNWR